MSTSARVWNKCGNCLKTAVCGGRATTSRTVRVRPNALPPRPAGESRRSSPLKPCEPRTDVGAEIFRNREIDRSGYRTKATATWWTSKPPESSRENRFRSPLLIIRTKYQVCRADVALHPKQRTHRRLPHQDGGFAETGLRLSQLQQLQIEG